MQMNQPIHTTTTTPEEQHPARAARRKGAGIAAAVFAMFIASPLLMLALGRTAGQLIAYALVIGLCWSDTRIHWGWRVLAAFLLMGCVYTQGQFIIHK